MATETYSQQHDISSIRWWLGTCARWGGLSGFSHPWVLIEYFGPFRKKLMFQLETVSWFTVSQNLMVSRTFRWKELVWLDDQGVRGILPDIIPKKPFWNGGILSIGNRRIWAITVYEPPWSLLFLGGNRGIGRFWPLRFPWSKRSVQTVPGPCGTSCRADSCCGQVGLVVGWLRLMDAKWLGELPLEAIVRGINSE